MINLPKLGIDKLQLFRFTNGFFLGLQGWIFHVLRDFICEGSQEQVQEDFIFKLGFTEATVFSSFMDMIREVGSGCLFEVGEEFQTQITTDRDLEEGEESCS